MTVVSLTFHENVIKVVLETPSKLQLKVLMEQNRARSVLRTVAIRFKFVGHTVKREMNKEIFFPRGELVEAHEPKK